MAQLIKAQDVKIITKDGECQVSISLELNINLNNNLVEISGQNIKNEKKDDVNWMIPDFTTSPKINFGKKGE